MDSLKYENIAVSTGLLNNQSFKTIYLDQFGVYIL